MLQPDHFGLVLERWSFVTVPIRGWCGPSWADFGLPEDGMRIYGYARSTKSHHQTRRLEGIGPDYIIVKDLNVSLVGPPSRSYSRWARKQGFEADVAVVYTMVRQSITSPYPHTLVWADIKMQKPPAKAIGWRFVKADGTPCLPEKGRQLRALFPPRYPDREKTTLPIAGVFEGCLVNEKGYRFILEHDPDPDYKVWCEHRGWEATVESALARIGPLI